MVAEPWWWLHGGCGGGRDSGVLMPVLAWRRCGDDGINGLGVMRWL